MSQPPNKGGSRPGGNKNTGANRSSGANQRSGGGQPQRSSAGSRPPVARQPISRTGRQVQAPEAGFSGTINRILPPFTAQRYIAIWLLGMIPLVLVILWLAQPWNSGNGGNGGSGGNTAAQQAVANLAAGKYMVLDTAKGRIIAKLHTNAADGVINTIANFEAKANAGEFNGRVFHRVEDWVIQGGDPLGNGTGGGKFPAEYNQLNFGAGALGVARGNDPTLNNDSQFFFTKSDSSFLNGQYTNWGQVVEGMDVVNTIAIGDQITSMAVVDKQ